MSPFLVDGFKRYVALAVVARNIQRLGAILRVQEQQAADRRTRHLQKSRLNIPLMLKKSSNHGKGVSEIRLEWLTCIIESDQ